MKKLLFLIFGLGTIILLVINYPGSSVNPSNNSENTIYEPITPLKISTIDVNKGNVTLNNVPDNTILLMHRDMSEDIPAGSTILLKDYLSSKGFSSFAKTINTSKNREYLFTQYFSGGAHCCAVLEAYQYDLSLKAYKFITNYSFDGDLIEMVYPFEVADRIEYFYCAYSNGSYISCPRAGYSKKLYFSNNEFTFKATGDIAHMEVCFKEYFNQTNIPELNNDGNDDGSRETVVNFLYDIYSINSDIARVFTLYDKYFPFTSDKKNLWFEIKSRLTGLPSENQPIQRNVTDNSQNYNLSSPGNDEPDISSLTCDELMELIVDQGDRVEQLDDSDLNSSALDYVALYEYDGTYYVIADFTSSRKRYIYCDVSKSNWNNFTDNPDNSFGSAFDDYLSRYTCSCN